MIFTSSFAGLKERLQDRRTLRENGSAGGSECDKLIPEIRNGYGADGQYDMDTLTFSNPLWSGEPVSVFFPKGMKGPRPVIFFSHGFGASDLKHAYTFFIRHMVSRGYIVIFSPYQTVRATFDERYATLWKGFELAVQKFSDKIDVTRVGFVGHSFGGGATPAMAFKGLVKAGWGGKAAFLYIMAPWYAYQTSPEELSKFPSHTFLVMQVYDKDDTNDHRMAIDLYRSIRLPESQKHFQIVSSGKINDCEIVADHATPNRNPSLRLKQYAIFRTFDALADRVLNGNSEGDRIISGTEVLSKDSGYLPLSIKAVPRPLLPEERYRFPWNSDKNPRRSSKSDGP